MHSGRSSRNKPLVLIGSAILVALLLINDPELLLCPVDLAIAMRGTEQHAVDAAITNHPPGSASGYPGGNGAYALHICSYSGLRPPCLRRNSSHSVTFLRRRGLLATAA